MFRPLAIVSFACTVLAGCMAPEKIPLAPEVPHHDAESAAHEPAKDPVEKVQPGDYVYDRFTRADLISAANSRYGAIELNIAAKPEVALQVAEEARTYLDLAAKRAEQAGKNAEATYSKRAGDLLVKATTEAKNASKQSMLTLAAARRALDMAIEQVNSTLTP